MKYYVAVKCHYTVQRYGNPLLSACGIALIACHFMLAYEYVPDSEVATFSQSLDTTMESIHTASLSFSEELDTDADFSIEIPDLPMDEPLSTSELAKLSTKQKPPTGISSLGTTCVEINAEIVKCSMFTWFYSIVR